MTATIGRHIPTGIPSRMQMRGAITNVLLLVTFVTVSAANNNHVQESSCLRNPPKLTQHLPTTVTTIQSSTAASHKQQHSFNCCISMLSNYKKPDQKTNGVDFQLTKNKHANI